jgi:hypothetical protein
MNAEPAFPAQVLEEGGETRLAGRLAPTRPARQHQLKHPEAKFLVPDSEIKSTLAWG